MTQNQETLRLAAETFYVLAARATSDAVKTHLKNMGDLCIICVPGKHRFTKKEIESMKAGQFIAEKCKAVEAQ